MKTRTDNLRKKLIWLAALVLLSPLGAHSATVNGTYTNGTDITQLFLWSVSAPLDVSFAAVDVNDPALFPAGWSVVPTAGDRLVAEGSTLAAGTGDFNIDFTYTGSTFRYQFAEVLYDGVTMTIQDTGKVHYNGSKFTTTPYTLSAAQITEINTHMASVSAVPIPSSVVLMMSAIGFMGIASRRSISSTTTKRG